MRTAILFPGQGSQEPNMGRDLAEHSSEAMDLWKRAEKICGADLREIYWDGDAEAMARTEFLQPALTVVNVNLWAKAAGRVEPACMAGHSLGEFSALAAAEVLPVDTILDMVSLRGKLMAQADPEGAGAMAAILKLDRETVDGMAQDAARDTDSLCIVANYNSPSQYVVSGHKAAVERIAELAKAAKGRAIPLAVSGAFHSPLMDEAAAEFAAALRKLPWAEAKFPVHLNVTAKPEQDPTVIAEAMSRQMISSVRWIDTMTDQAAMGVRRWVELGPKGVLAKLAQANLKDLPELADEEWTTENVSSLEQVSTLSFSE